MRHLFILVLACALGASSAFAASTSGPHSLAKRSASAKHTAHARDHRDARGGAGLGGIHPLVGSGDY